MATRDEVDRMLVTYEQGPDDPELADLMRGYLETSGAGVEPAGRSRRPMATRGPGRGRSASG